MRCRYTCVRSMTGQSKVVSHSDSDNLPRWSSVGPHSLNLSQHSSVKIRRQLPELSLPPLFLEQHDILTAQNNNKKTSPNPATISSPLGISGTLLVLSSPAKKSPPPSDHSQPTSNAFATGLDSESYPRYLSDNSRADRYLTKLTISIPLFTSHNSVGKLILS